MTKYKITMKDGNVLEIISMLTKKQVVSMKQAGETWHCGYGITIEMDYIDQIEVLSD